MRKIIGKGYSLFHLLQVLMESFIINILKFSHKANFRKILKKKSIFLINKTKTILLKIMSIYKVKFLSDNTNFFEYSTN